MLNFTHLVHGKAIFYFSLEFIPIKVIDHIKIEKQKLRKIKLL